jgi:hypothetical protein
MKFAIKNIYVLFTILFLIVLPVGVLHAGKFYTDIQSQPLNVTQNIEEGKSFELSQGQIKSRVEHKLLNYLLGNTIDKYLDFGPDDDIAKKSSQRLKIRVDKHKLFFIYQRQFE